MLAAQLEGWRRHFSHKRVLILDGETFDTDAGLQAAVDHMSAFLQMPASDSDSLRAAAPLAAPALPAELESLLQQVLDPQRTALAIAPKQK
jgi:hypothetical protein